MDRKVFRLRQIPPDIDRLDVVKLLAGALGIEASAINICSLVGDVNIWKRTQTATLTLNPIALKSDLERTLPLTTDEWNLKAENIQSSLILDTHFRGLTPLNEPSTHVAE